MDIRVKNIIFALMILFLNDIAGSEILLILVFILIFFGSKSIPGIAKTMGRTIRQIKDASDEVQNEIRKSTSDMKGDMNFSHLIKETMDDIQQPLDQYADDLDHAIKYQAPAKSKIPGIEQVQNPADNTVHAAAESSPESMVNPDQIVSTDKDNSENKEAV